MSNKIIFLFVLIISFCFSSAYSDDAEKAMVSSTTTCAGQALQLNGYGTRKKLFIKLYVASLYVQEKQSDNNKLLEMQQAMCIRLNITSSKITSEKMIKATREGFEKSTKGNLEPIADEVETFLSWLKQPIKKGDVFEFAFLPHNETLVSKNDNSLGKLENKAFSAALFGIWLGDMPAQRDLKENLLGN